MSTSISSDILKRLWKSRRTMLEVLEARRYQEASESHLDYEDFVEWAANDDEATIRGAMTLVMEKNATDPMKIMVVWPVELKLGTNVREIISDMEEKGLSRVIVVINHSATHWCKSIIRNLRTKKTYIDVYTLDEAQFNIMKHRLVPEHVICSVAGKKRVMSSYAVNADQLPHIRPSDPTVRHLGAIRGQLIKITRDSETQPGFNSISYRLVM